MGSTVTRKDELLAEHSGKAVGGRDSIPVLLQLLGGGVIDELFVVRGDLAEPSF